jgi:hypothetical protein
MLYTDQFEVRGVFPSCQLVGSYLRVEHEHEINTGLFLVLCGFDFHQT